jgi:hypothetical protein
MSLQDEIAANLERTKHKEAEAEAAQQELDELRTRIAKGESTGDRIRDYVIRKIGFRPSADAFHKELSALEQRLAGMTGQFGLLIEKEYREANHASCTRTFGHERTKLTLFVLSGEQLALNFDGWKEQLLPIANTAEYDSDRYETIRALKGADVDFLRMVSFLARASAGSYRAELLIGDQEVHAWLAADDQSYQPSKSLYLLRSLADAVGRPLQDAPVFTECVAKEREECLKKLHKACGDRAVHRHQLETISRHRRDYIGEVASAIEKLRTAVQHIRELLDDAKSLGLDDPLVTELRKEYAPKKEPSA